MNADQMIGAIAERVPKDADVERREDGLLYCTRCHTPRQRRITILGKERIVPLVCKCMAERMKAEEEELKRYEREKRIQRIRDAAFPAKPMQQYTFEADDQARPEISSAMKAYVEHFGEMRKEGKGLLLCGPPGTGKTFYAACIVNALIDQGYPCIMTTFSRLANTISGMWEGKQEYIDSLTRYALVAIDDLGVERDTEYMNENVTTIIDTLYKAQVPMLITSNYTPRQIANKEAEIRKVRGYDRILEVCHPVKVDGKSRRRAAGNASYDRMNKLLGLSDGNVTEEYHEKDRATD